MLNVKCGYIHWIPMATAARCFDVIRRGHGGAEETREIWRLDDGAGGAWEFNDNSVGI